MNTGTFTKFSVAWLNSPPPKKKNNNNNKSRIKDNVAFMERCSLIICHTIKRLFYSVKKKMVEKCLIGQSKVQLSGIFSLFGLLTCGFQPPIPPPKPREKIY